MPYYFAYGSNMDTNQMQQRLESACLSVVSVAKLVGWHLVFDKISKDGTGKANLLQDEHGEVWGVVYQITDEQMTKLDGFEKGYSRKEVEIALREDNTRLNVITYISDKRNSTLHPSRDYLHIIIQGAREHHLPEEYIRQIATQAGVQD